jgi:hypothetical protein
MTDSERQQILKMIEDGKISAEQGLVLMQALDQEPEDISEDEPARLEAPEVEVLPSFAPDMGSSAQAEPASDPEFERKINRFRRLWVIPLWLGVAVTVAGAYGMYTALQSSGFGFWFYFAWLPFLLGVLLVALGFSSRTSRWIYMNIEQRPGQSPQRIILAFPISLVNWVLKFTQGSLPGNDRGATNEVMSALFESTRSNEPLMVDVHEDDGEHVQIYIG